LSLFPPFHAPDISFIYLEVSEVRVNGIKFSHDLISSLSCRADVFTATARRGYSFEVATSLVTATNQPFPLLINPCSAVVIAHDHRRHLGPRAKPSTDSRFCRRLTASMS
jgi:L-ascorbate metabolism protein UlaG (beta-lactamase superfamily)